MKIVISTFALALALLLNGCGKDTDTTSSQAETPALQEAAPAQEMSEESTVENSAEATEEAVDEIVDDATTAIEGAAEDAATEIEGAVEEAESAMEELEQNAGDADGQPAAEGGN